jgi:isopentenyl-diphosphate Delta-isomerase
MEEVILVDENDNSIGTMEKMEAHQKGLLHRAFSILVFNSSGDMLVQKRASTKYHSGGLWTNACCSHPRPDEPISLSTRRRLKYEMGIDLEPEFAYKFIYKTSLDQNLVEHELDHVFTAVFDGTPEVNPQEVDEWKFVALDDLRRDVKLHPERYTYWFKVILGHGQLEQHLR